MGEQNQYRENRRRAAEIQGTIDAFRKEYQSFLSGHETEDNMTQDYWYSLYLSRKRLQEKQTHLSVNCSKIPYHDSGKRKTQRYEDLHRDKVEIGQTAYYFNEDGKNSAITVKEPLRLQKNYELSGNRRFEEKNEVIGEYVIVDSVHTKDAYVCPNCGNEGKLEELLAGCAYCGTVFSLKDFNKKIAAFGYRRNPLAPIRESLSKLFKMNGGAIAICFILMLVLTIIGSASLLLSAVSMVLFISFTVFVIGACVIWYIICSYAEEGNRSASVSSENRILQSIRRYHTHFSAEQFLACMSYKIKAVHFADKKDEIAAFLDRNSEINLPSYGNVLDCEIESAEIVGYGESAERGEQQIDVKAQLCLTCDDGRRVRQRKENIRLRAVTDKDNRTQLKNETVIYTCKNCGSSISFLNGGVCESCGTGIDLYQYDWVISDYRVISDKKVRRPIFPIVISIIMIIALIITLVVPVVIGSKLDNSGLGDSYNIEMNGGTMEIHKR